MSRRNAHEPVVLGGRSRVAAASTHTRARFVQLRADPGIAFVLGGAPPPVDHADIISMFRRGRETCAWARELIVTISGPPVPKGRPRSTRTGRVYTPAKTRAYEKHVARTCMQHLTELGAAANWPRLAEYEVSLLVYRATKRGDGDNFLKAFSDGAEGVLWANDRQIKKATVELLLDRVNPRIEASVWARETSHE
jgi:Holliday junction resolvase RusA-like endonuclease